MMTPSDEISGVAAIFTGIGGFGALAYYLLSRQQSKPQLKLDVSIREGHYDPRETYLYYAARNVGQVSVHMEWFGLRLINKEIFFQSYVMSYSMEVVPFAIPMNRRYRKEILPGKAYETSIELDIFAQFFLQNGFKDSVQVTPYLGDERGNVYKGKPFLVPLKNA